MNVKILYLGRKEPDVQEEAKMWLSNNVNQKDSVLFGDWWHRIIQLCVVVAQKTRSIFICIS